MVSCAFALVLSLAAALSAPQSGNGRVVDPDGRPVANAPIAIDGPLGASIIVSTGDDGRFVIPHDLPPGTYRLHVNVEGFAADPMIVTVPSEEIGRAHV